ncbi:MAG: hypothetical protein U5R31_04600 [Acidimicrobiia bacterium]|nr:hypothetical protein [Acidimicrobiia bacterium]
MRRLVVTAALVAGPALLGVAACSDEDDGEPLTVEAFCERLTEVRDLDDQLGRIETGELEGTYEQLRTSRPRLRRRSNRRCAR